MLELVSIGRIIMLVAHKKHYSSMVDASTTWLTCWWHIKKHPQHTLWVVGFGKGIPPHEIENQYNPGLGIPQMMTMMMMMYVEVIDSVLEWLMICWYYWQCMSEVLNKSPIHGYIMCLFTTYLKLSESFLWYIVTPCNKKSKEIYAVCGIQ